MFPYLCRYTQIPKVTICVFQLRSRLFRRSLAGGEKREVLGNHLEGWISRAQSCWPRWFHRHYSSWLVVESTLWKIWLTSSVGMMILPNWMESHKIPWFQTTKQLMSNDSHVASNPSFADIYSTYLLVGSPTTCPVRTLPISRIPMRLAGSQKTCQMTFGIFNVPCFLGSNPNKHGKFSISATCFWQIPLESHKIWTSEMLVPQFWSWYWWMFMKDKNRTWMWYWG